MLKLTAKTGLGVPVLLLGLSGENVTRLAAGEPLRVRAAELQQMGLPALEIGLVYGRTEEDILAEIKRSGGAVRETPPEPSPGADQG